MLVLCLVAAAIGYWCRVIMVVYAVALTLITRVDIHATQKKGKYLSHVHICDSASSKVIHHKLMIGHFVLSHGFGLQRLALIGSSGSFCCGGVGVESEDSPSERVPERSYESRGLSRKVLVPWSHVRRCSLQDCAYGV